MARIYFLSGRGRGSMARTTIIEVAKYLLSLEPMTHKKLQKLCYYSYAWYLTLYKERLFVNNFQAWIHGPVDPELYQKYKHYGWTPIPKSGDEAVLSPDLKEFIDQVYHSYGHLTGDQLEWLTHTEDPWRKAREGLEEYEPSTNLIDDRVIEEYYTKVYEYGQND